MKNLTLLAAFAAFVSLGAQAHAQNNTAWIIRDAGYQASSVVIAVHTNRTQERIAERQADSWDRQTASQERIARDQISAQVEMDRNRTAAEVYRTAAETGRSGDVYMKNGQVSARLDPHDRPLPRERRDNNGYGGPRVR